jgi:hypothetical protein
MILERDKICLGQQLVSVRSERDRKDPVPIRMSLRVLPERRDVSAPAITIFGSTSTTAAVCRASSIATGGGTLPSAGSLRKNTNTRRGGATTRRVLIAASRQVSPPIPLADRAASNRAR